MAIKQVKIGSDLHNLQASQVLITRPSNVLTAAAAMESHTEEIYFLGSDGLSAGAPVNYCIINAKRGAGERTILDCYALQTGDHYINGNMTVTDTTTWTGWILQPNPTQIENLQTQINSKDSLIWNTF